jgi:hypothetical protein
MIMESNISAFSLNLSTKQLADGDAGDGLIS